MGTAIETDIDQVVAVATDYLETFYSATSEERANRIRHALHPQLAERSPHYLEEDWSFRELTFTVMVEHAAPSSIEHEPR